MMNGQRKTAGCVILYITGGQKEDRHARGKQAGLVMGGTGQRRISRRKGTGRDVREVSRN